MPYCGLLFFISQVPVYITVFWSGEDSEGVRRYYLSLPIKFLSILGAHIVLPSPIVSHFQLQKTAKLADLAHSRIHSLVYRSTAVIYHTSQLPDLILLVSPQLK
jgi:hypothetical protein